MITCPSCDADIDVEEEDLDEGDELICEECGAAFSVTSVDPLELEPTDEEDEDEEEEDFDLAEEEDEDEEENWR
jgi:alpha-aminoadipate carrier protein LysW